MCVCGFYSHSLFLRLRKSQELQGSCVRKKFLCFPVVSYVGFLCRPESEFLAQHVSLLLEGLVKTLCFQSSSFEVEPD